MTLRADLLFEKFFHPFHALFILHLVQRVQHGRRRAVIGEIHLAGSRRIRLFGPVKDMLFHHRTVIDDLFFLIGQIPERNIRPHTHGPADISHQGPHQGIPGRNGAVIDGEALVRDQGAAVHRTDRTGPSAALAGPLRIEGQFLRTWTVKTLAAFRADDLLHQGNLKSRFNIVAVRAAVRRKARKHKTETV